MIMCALMIQIDNSVFMAGKLSQLLSKYICLLNSLFVHISCKKAHKLIKYTCPNQIHVLATKIEINVYKIIYRIFIISYNQNPEIMLISY